MVNQDFTIVSSLIEENNLKSENYKIYSGTWGDPKVTDQELNKLYRDAKLTIIPLVNTLQPSGQSVALQSMSQGTPVFISKTKGFWEPDSFKNNEHLIFLESEDTDEWEKKINKTVNK